MAKRLLTLCSVALGPFLSAPCTAEAQGSLPNISGTYRCVPDSRPCRSTTFVVSQSGGKLNVKSEQGEIGTGEVTSNVSVSLGAPWNLLGTILSDQRTIELSAGTR